MVNFFKIFVDCLSSSLVYIYQSHIDESQLRIQNFVNIYLHLNPNLLFETTSLK